MKKLSLLVFVALLFSSYLTCRCENQFYYAEKEKYPLVPVDAKRAILSLPSQKNNDTAYVERVGARIHVIDITETPNSKETQNKICEGENGELILPIFNINNTEVILLPEIIVKPKSSTYDISSICSKYNLKLVKSTSIYQIYSVPIDKDVVDVANKIYETGEFDFAYPNFFCSAELNAYIPNDPYFSYQITCHNVGQTINDGHSGTVDADINAPEAWDITKGSSNIVIAVFDEGVTSNHPDLPNSRQVRLNGSNFGSGNANDPSPVGNANHGNACAGVIAATMNNNEGIAGIAPNCKIMPLRLDATSSSADLADGILFAAANGAKVISCSWGYPNSNSNLYPVIKAAIDTVIHHNVVVLFAAGNTANHVYSYDGYVTFPANADVPNLITVGASDRYDHMANYSPKSSLIDFVAPSHRAYSSQIYGETLEMWSLDIPSSAGWNPLNTQLDDGLIIGSTLPNSGTNYLSYTGRFGGTSHACPVVAGVVALMLSVNPNLSPSGIYNKLTTTSAKVGGYTYTNGRCNEMGYGRVDAYAAVWEAMNIYILGANSFCTSASYQVQNLPTNSTVSWSYETSISQVGSYPVIILSSTTGSSITVQRGTYVLTDLNGQPLPPEPYEGNVTLKATVTINGVSRTFTKVITLPHDVAPTLPASSLGTLHINESRTFTISNCLNTSSNHLIWNITLPKTTVPFTHYGRSWSVTPTQSGTLKIELYNSENCDNTLHNTYNIVVSKLNPINPFDPLALFPNPVVSGSVDIQVIDQNYANRGNEEDVTFYSDIDYTLELWNESSRAIRSVNSTIRGEKDVVTMDVSGLPNGIYFLSVKVDDEIITTSKMIVNR